MDTSERPDDEDREVTEACLRCDTDAGEPHPKLNSLINPMVRGYEDLDENR